jgi:cytochrome c-type biogenesis protein
VATGSMLLLAYSLGLGVPFVAVAVLFSRMMPVVRWVARRSLAINRVAGSVLIVVGALIFTGRLGVLAAWFTRVLPTLPQ